MWYLAEMAGVTNRIPNSISTIGADQSDVQLLCVDYERTKLLEKFFSIKTDFDYAFEFFDNFFASFQYSLESYTLQEISYRIKIYLYSAYEYIEALDSLLQQLYPTEVVYKKDTMHEGKKILKEISSGIYDSSFSYRLSYNLRNHLQHSGNNTLNYNFDQTQGNRILLNSHDFARSDNYIQKRFSTELLSKEPVTINVIEHLYEYKNDIDELFNAIHCFCSDVLIDEKLIIYIRTCNIIDRYSSKQDVDYALIETELLDGKQTTFTIKRINYPEIKDSIREFIKICGEDNYRRLSDLATKNL